VEHPEPLFELKAEPASFSEALALQMRRHGDSCWRLHKAVVRSRDHFDRRTIQDWLNEGCVPQTALSKTILARIERRYTLPAGYFKRLLPNASRATTSHRFVDAAQAERRRLAWHLPDDFGSRSPAERAEILSWVRTNVLGRTTAYGRFQAEAMKHRFALRFDPLPRRATTRSRPERLDRIAPRALQVEMDRLVEFKTATLTKIGVERNGVWCEETRDQRIEHFSLMFGAMTAAADGPVAGMGLTADDLTFAMLAFPQVWDWYLNWRLRRRGFFTTWEVDMLRLGMALCRRETGWLRQSPDLANRLSSAGLISDEDIDRARLDWQGACDRLWDYAWSRVKEVARVARVHRDPFEPILPILESSSPVAAYRLITEEIDRRTPDARRYPVAAAEAVRSYLMLRLGLHLGVRQRNLRQLMLCRPGEQQRTERELETLRRGELRWIDQTQQWQVFIPSIAFKNGRSSFFDDRPFRLILPDLAGLYEHLQDYVRLHRDRLLKGSSDPGTLFVKTVKAKTKDASYEGTTFYEAWRLAVQRYGIWNPYTKRGAIAGLLPHGPHCVRDVLATHVLKQTGSYEQASYAIQDTPETVAKHYARFLPQDKAALAADILNQAWR